MLRFKQYLRLLNPPELDEIFTTEDGTNARVLWEGKWVDGRFKNNIRIDRNTHLQSGEKHYHIYGRKGGLIGVVHADGSLSHGGEPVKLSKEDAATLASDGVPIRKDRIVEWVLIDVAQELLLG